MWASVAKAKVPKAAEAPKADAPNLAGSTGSTPGSSPGIGAAAAAPAAASASNVAAPAKPSAAAVVAGGRKTAAQVAAGGSRAQRLAACQELVGYEVQLECTARETKTSLRGIIYAAFGSMLVLQEPSGIRLVNIMTLGKKPVVLNEKDGTPGKRKIADLAPRHGLDEGVQAALTEKFEVAKAKRELMLANRNPLASAAAQRVFDDLQKTFTCQWVGTTICIRDLGDLRIPEPYTADAVTGSQERAVERVKIMVEQMHLSADESPKAVAAAAASDNGAGAPPAGPN